MGEMMKEPKDGKPAFGEIVFGVVMTIMAIPFLVVATCMPALVVAQAGNYFIAEAVWVGGTLAFAIWRAAVTENPGIRWTIILVIAVAVIVGTVMVIHNPSLVTWWR